MNRHFNDAMYYARRTAESLFNGFYDEVEPYLDEATERYYDVRGIERPSEPGRIETLRAELDELEDRASGEARQVAQNVRHRIGGRRSQQ